jgi:hypothetical protein
MKMPITDEILNAFVDQQLTPSEMGEVFEAIKQDAELAKRSCEVRQLKSLVKHAYDGIEPNQPAQWRVGQSRGVQALAAVLLMGLGGLIGWSLHPAGSILPPALMQGSEFMQASAHGEPRDNRIILHLDSDKPERMAAVLDYADQILDNAKKEGVEARLEIVANSYGLNLLRAGYTPHLARIQALANKHANLSFIACGQTVARFKRDGQDVTLIEQAKMAPSAIGEVVSKMKEGWTYIRV